MTSIKGTRTEQNLLKSFAGESQARNRYGFFARTAQKEGYEYIAQIFNMTAEQERQHAKRFFSFLEGGTVEITASYPAGILTGSTLDNLKAAASGEYEEWDELYPKFADIAEEEGFSEIADQYRRICVAEKHHEERYRQFIKMLESGTAFERPTVQKWECLECGYIHEGTSAPNLCPACRHPQAFYRLKVEMI